MEDMNISHKIFYEPDHDTGYTAMACGPIDEKDKHLFKKYRLLK